MYTTISELSKSQTPEFITSLFKETSNSDFIIYEGSDSESVLNKAYSSYLKCNATKDQDYPLSCIKITPKNASKLAPIGIIGGMGPLATFYFLRKLHQTIDIPTVTFMCCKAQDRKEAYQNPIMHQQLSSLLANVASYLSTEHNCNSIVMPCNTAHCFASNISSFKSLISATTHYIAQNNIKKMMVLSTNTTVNAGLYNNSCDSVIYPNSKMQKLVTEIIYNEIKYFGIVTEKSIRNLKIVLQTYVKQGITTFALCCTELPIIAATPEIQEFLSAFHTPITLVDPMNALINSLKSC
jgi:aspartate racemase